MRTFTMALVFVAACLISRTDAIGQTCVNGVCTIPSTTTWAAACGANDASRDGCTNCGCQAPVQSTRIVHTSVHQRSVFRGRVRLLQRRPIRALLLRGGCR